MADPRLALLDWALQQRGILAFLRDPATPLPSGAPPLLAPQTASR